MIPKYLSNLFNFLTKICLKNICVKTFFLQSMSDDLIMNATTFKNMLMSFSI